MNELAVTGIVLALLALFITGRTIVRLNAEWDIYRLERKFDRLCRRAVDREEHQ